MANEQKQVVVDKKQIYVGKGAGESARDCAGSVS